MDDAASNELERDLREIFQLVDRDGGGTSKFSFSFLVDLSNGCLSSFFFLLSSFFFLLSSFFFLLFSLEIFSHTHHLFGVLLYFLVDMDELNQLMQMLNMPVASGQMSQMMSEISSDEDGEISLDDFLIAMKAEQTNPHMKHLLLRDFELFRPSNCAPGYIPRDQLVELLLTYTNDNGLEESSDDIGSKKNNDSNKNDDNDNQKTTDTDTNAEKDATATQSLPEIDRGQEQNAWTKSGLRDLIHNIPMNCFAENNKNLIHFEKLIETMLVTTLDPFLVEDNQ